MKRGLQGYIIRRLIYAVLIAFGVVTITFVLLRLGPSSPADKYLANMSARTQDPSQVIAAIEARYGLDKPIYEQYRQDFEEIIIYRGEETIEKSVTEPSKKLSKSSFF